MRFAGARLLGPTGSLQCSPLPRSALASSQRTGTAGQGPEAQAALPLGNTSGPRFAPWFAAKRAAHPGCTGTARPGPLGKATWAASNPYSVPQLDLSPRTQRKAKTKSAKEAERFQTHLREYQFKFAPVLLICVLCGLGGRMVS